MEARRLHAEEKSRREDRLSTPQTQAQQPLRPVTQDWVDANLFQPHAVVHTRGARTQPDQDLEASVVGATVEPGLRKRERMGSPSIAVAHQLVMTSGSDVVSTGAKKQI